jgi:hypothetical protein
MTGNSVHFTRKLQPFRLPPELEDTLCVDTDLPLYVLIACWALLKRTPVTVRDVRLAFDISLRRASDLLEYMTEQGAGVVQAECVLLPSVRGKKCMCRAWMVFSVNAKLARHHRIHVLRPVQAKKRGVTELKRKRTPGTVNDLIAEKLENAGLWRRAAARWREVMQNCEADAQIEWISQRRNYCYSRI